MALHRECCFPNCTKLCLKKVTFAGFRGEIAPLDPPLYLTHILLNVTTTEIVRSLEKYSFVFSTSLTLQLPDFIRFPFKV